jgi:hypothetical protein
MGTTIYRDCRDSRSSRIRNITDRSSRGPQRLLINYWSGNRADIEGH